MSKNQDDLRNLITRDFLNTPAVVYMMVLARKLLEENKLKTTFKQLNFYCCWTVHANLSEDESCQIILLKLTEVLSHLVFLKKYRIADDGGYIWNGDEALNIEINKFLGLDYLRKEIIDLFQQLNIPTEIIKNDGKWYQFCEILCRHLVEQKIVPPFNNLKKREFFSDIQQITQLEKWQVIGFSLVYNDDLIPELFRKLHEAYKIFFEMETISNEYFVGPFWIPEELKQSPRSST